jgi:hypothetical protein
MARGAWLPVHCMIYLLKYSGPLPTSGTSRAVHFSHYTSYVMQCVATFLQKKAALTGYPYRDVYISTQKDTVERSDQNNNFRYEYKFRDVGTSQPIRK